MRCHCRAARPVRGDQLDTPVPLTARPEWLIVLPIVVLPFAIKVWWFLAAFGALYAASLASYFRERIRRRMLAQIPPGGPGAGPGSRWSCSVPWG